MSGRLPPLRASSRTAASSSSRISPEDCIEREQHAGPGLEYTENLNQIPGYMGDPLPTGAMSPRQLSVVGSGVTVGGTAGAVRQQVSLEAFPEAPSARDLATPAALITSTGAPMQPRRLFDSPQRERKVISEYAACMRSTAGDVGAEKHPGASMLAVQSEWASNSTAGVGSGQRITLPDHRRLPRFGDRDSVGTAVPSFHPSTLDIEMGSGPNSTFNMPVVNLTPSAAPLQQRLLSKELKRSCSDSSALRVGNGNTTLDGERWGGVPEEAGEGIGEESSDENKKDTFADGKGSGARVDCGKGKGRVLLRMQSCPTELEQRKHVGGGSIRRDGIVNVANLISHHGVLATSSPAQRGVMSGTPFSRRASIADTPGAWKLKKMSSLVPNRRTISGSGGGSVREAGGRQLTISNSLCRKLGDATFDKVPFYPSPYMSFSTVGGQSPAATLSTTRAASMTSMFHPINMTPGGGLRRQKTHTGRYSHDDAGHSSALSSKLRRMSSAMRNAAHYLSLVVAEHPAEEHQRFLELEEEEEELRAQHSNYAGTPVGAINNSTCDVIPPTISQGASLNASFIVDDYRDAIPGGSLSRHNTHIPGYNEDGSMTIARARWLSAGETIVRSHYLYNFAATMTDTSAAPSDRLHAVVHMEWMLWDNPNKRKVVSVLTNLVKGQKPSMGEMLHVELTMTGERILCWFTPAEMDQHRPYFSLVYVIFILTTFFFMAGDFALYAHTVSPSYRLQHGPQRLVAWLSPDSDLAFSFDYLREWGSRYAPDIADGEWYRWVTSVFIHASFLHMLSNLLLTLVLSMHLETKYGAWRIALVWVISCGGGQLVSAAAEDPCGQFVGSSGGVFGMMGLFIADMIVNFHTISRPILRCLLILLFIAFFVITIVRDINTSHLSHIGGLASGLFPAFLFLPKLKIGGRRWKWMCRCLGTIAIVCIFTVCPIYLSAKKLKNLCCVLTDEGLHMNSPGGDCLA